MIEIRARRDTDDMSAISNIYEQSWKYAYQGILPDEYLNGIPVGQWANGLHQPGRHSILLFEDQKLLGTSSYCGARQEDMGGYGEIVSIYLLPEAMHKGYGRMLMQAVITELEKMGYQKAYLWVLEENKNARRFYEHMGFRASGKSSADIYAGWEVREVQYVIEMKEYKFYGWQNADIPAATDAYKQIKDPRHLYDLLSEIWCADTCAPRMRDGWTRENRTLGQCSITAFLAQDIFGGEVYGILRPGGNYHCYNVAGDCVFDLTSEQFGEEILSYENNPVQSREAHFAKEEKLLRYEYLKEELRKKISSK